MFCIAISLKKIVKIDELHFVTGLLTPLFYNRKKKRTQINGIRFSPHSQHMSI